MKRTVMFSCLLSCLLVVGVMLASDGVPADNAKPAAEGAMVGHAIAGTELPGGCPELR